MKKRRIGVDLDNTIACYERVFEPIALQMGLISKRAKVGPSCKSVKPFKKKEGTIFGHSCRGRFMDPGCDGLPPLSEFESIFSKQRREGMKSGLLAIAPDGRLSGLLTISGSQPSSGSTPQDF
jgi:hypothetical protein